MIASAPHQQSFSDIPLFLFSSSFAAGIVVAQLPQISLNQAIAAAALCAGLSVVALVSNRLLSSTLSLTLAFCFLGAAFGVAEKGRSEPTGIRRLLQNRILIVGEPVELTGVVQGPPEHAPDMIYAMLDARSYRSNQDERPASGAVMLSLPLNAASPSDYDALEIRHGATLRIMTTLDRSDRFHNPGVSTFTEFLDRKGYDATAIIKSPLLIERLGDEPVLLPLAWLYAWRRQIELRIQRTFSRDTAAVLNAALLGNRHGLTRQTAERFREGGTFHVLVISGLHISFIGAVVLLIAKRLTRRKLTQFLWSTTLLWSYTLAVGAEASVVRAAFMFTFIALAPLLFRRASALNALGGAALVLLSWRPGELFSPSFQLTFLSVAAIVAIAWPTLSCLGAIGRWRPSRDTPAPPGGPVWLRRFSELLFWSEKRWRDEVSQSNYNYRLFKHSAAAKLERFHLQSALRYAFAAILISASVQAALLPLQVLYFHRLSLASIVLNIGVSVLMASASLIAICAMIVGTLSVVLATPLVAIANGANWMILHSVDPFAYLGLASIRLPEYSGWAAAIYFLYYLPLTLLTLQLMRWQPLKPPKRPFRTRWWLGLPLMGYGLLSTTILLHPFSTGTTGGRLRIDFLDVGQGDSALLTMPDGTTLLIDGGGRPDFTRTDVRQRDLFERDTRSIGEAVVSEYLWWRGIDSVDYVLATHADADHIDGLNDVVRNFIVRAALVGRTPSDDPEYAKFSVTTEAQSIPVFVTSSSDTFLFGDVSARVLWPPPVRKQNAPSHNNDSVVLQVRYGNRQMLLTGDIEKGAESSLVRRGADLRSDVVKVAHHGSKTSSIDGFVQATSPKLAIISVGERSMFGHPNREVVTRWQASGAEVLITGKCGTITVSTDGTKLLLETFLDRSGD